MLGGPVIPSEVNGNPQRCALVDDFTNIVMNVIMADPAVDPSPENFTVVGIPDDSLVSYGWVYDPSTQTFTDPNPQPVEPGS